jgi:antirestriction protein ArdC
MPDVYTIVTDRIMAALERGTVPWHRPWSGQANAPRNFVTTRGYRGVNVFILSATASSAGYSSPFWATFNQIRGLGGHVKRGERGTPVVFWKVNERQTETEDGGEDVERYAVLRYYVVFNVKQCEGLRVPVLSGRTVEPIGECERIVAGMPNPPAIHHGGNQAFYRPSTDSVTVPAREAFETAESFYSVLLHELTHATGHPKRLNRSGIANLEAFGSHAYSREELVAEMGAAFLCGHAGIAQRTVDQSASYIATWLRVLANDRRMVVMAAGQAQKAADYILNVQACAAEEAAAIAA